VAVAHRQSPSAPAVKVRASGARRFVVVVVYVIARACAYTHRTLATLYALNKVLAARRPLNALLFSYLPRMSTAVVAPTVRETTPALGR
jgi:hypothetical protein